MSDKKEYMECPKCGGLMEKQGSFYQCTNCCYLCQFQQRGIISKEPDNQRPNTFFGEVKE